MSIEASEISMALSCIWAWLIPHFYIEFMEYRVAAATVSIESSSVVQRDENANIEQNDSPAVQTQNNNENTDEENDDDDSQSDGNKRNTSFQNETEIAILRGAAAALLILIVVYSASAIGIALPTRNMDRRAAAIVIGLGRILSAFLFAVFSVEIPKWLGVTYSSQRGNYYKKQVSPTKLTVKELSFRVCWGILGHFFVMYGIMLLYFSSPSTWSIPISTAIGIAFGFGTVWAVYVGRTKYKEHTTTIAFVFSFVIMVSSAAAFSAGCWYIKEVWYDEDIGYHEEYTLLTFFGWLALCVVANYFYYRLTRRKLAAAAADGNSASGAGSSAGEANDLVARSLWRYQSQVFQPPDSVCFAATELSKATAHVAVATVSSPFKKAGSTITKIRTSSFGSSRHSTRHDEDTIENVNDDLFPRRRAVSADAGPTDLLPQPIPNRSRTNTEPTVVGTSSVNSVSNNRARSYSDTSYTSSACKEEDPTQTGFSASTLISSSVPPVPSLELGFHHSGSNPLCTINSRTSINFGGDNKMNNANGSSFDRPREHDTSAMDVDLSNQPSRDLEQPIVEEEGADDRSIFEHDRDPTLWFMIKTNTCCGKRRHYKIPPRKGWERILNFLKWTLWAITSALHLYFLIISILATAQQERVRAALPGTFSLLYPPDYVESTMCAWNEASPAADIRTFDSLVEVVESNYTVIHCGACGSCSNWNDLRLQWTTRRNLAELGQECVKKKLFGGSADDVQECNEELIGFTKECSACWTVDQLCAKTNCVFIYLQSLLVNQVSNFNVDSNDITTTTCDEALCGPEFVPCSGATRRRMNIVSDIPRPPNQQCTVAHDDWSSAFNHP